MQQYIGIAVFAAGAVWLLVQVGMKFWPKRETLGRTVVPTNGGSYIRSSDQKAPAGFKEHMAIIQEASPSASAEVRWQYALEGLTEALVLRREVERLGKEST